MRVLIIEDSDTIRKMLEALLSGRGHEVQGAVTGTKGIDLAASAPPDAILLDIHLPGTHDGFDVCSKLRAMEATRHVPIIVISALDDPESRQRARDAGANAYYSKPFSPTALLKELETIETRESARWSVKS
jgi:DNA-binding response OmpR family regulator